VEKDGMKYAMKQLLKEEVIKVNAYCCLISLVWENGTSFPRVGPHEET
jgi:hypothetical protein